MNIFEKLNFFKNPATFKFMAYRLEVHDVVSHRKTLIGNNFWKENNL